MTQELENRILELESALKSLVGFTDISDDFPNSLFCTASVEQVDLRKAEHLGMVEVRDRIKRMNIKSLGQSIWLDGVTVGDYRKAQRVLRNEG